MTTQENRQRTQSLLRSVARKKPRKRLPLQVPPKAIARTYARELLSFVAEMRAETNAFLEEMRPMLAVAQAERRFDAGEESRISAFADRLRARFTEKASQLSGFARQLAGRISGHNKQQLGNQVKAALGSDVFIADRRLGLRVQAFAAENVSLIKGLTQDTASKIEKAAIRAINNATPHQTLAKELRDVYGISENRAKLIARDQVGKLYGQINADRQRELGIDKFIWRTVKDERVRDEHEALDGEIFSYADGGHPEEGLPGEPINCRCYAEPVFDDILSGVTNV